MSPRPPVLVADLAALAGAIERWAADLALAEEPARFVAALEAASPEPRRRPDGAPPRAPNEPGGRSRRPSGAGASKAPRRQIG